MHHQEESCVAVFGGAAPSPRLCSLSAEPLTAPESVRPRSAPGAVTPSPPAPRHLAPGCTLPGPLPPSSRPPWALDGSGPDCTALSTGVALTLLLPFLPLPAGGRRQRRQLGRRTRRPPALEEGGRAGGRGRARRAARERCGRQVPQAEGGQGRQGLWEGAEGPSGAGSPEGLRPKSAGSPPEPPGGSVGDTHTTTSKAGGRAALGLLQPSPCRRVPFPGLRGSSEPCEGREDSGAGERAPPGCQGGGGAAVPGWGCVPGAG